MAMTHTEWQPTPQLRFSAARVLQQLWSREIFEGRLHEPDIHGRETKWRDVPSEIANIHITLGVGPPHHANDNGEQPAQPKVPFLSRADALKLKAIAEQALHNPNYSDRNVPEAERRMFVRYIDVLSLIEQSYSAHLGLATTGQMIEEIKSRIEVHFPGGLEYRTVGD